MTGVEAAISSHEEHHISHTINNQLLYICIYDQAQLMLCHCIGGVIPGCDVICDNSSDGYSCNMLQFVGSTFLFAINLSTPSRGCINYKRIHVALHMSFSLEFEPNQSTTIKKTSMKVFNSYVW